MQTVPRSFVIFYYGELPSIRFQRQGSFFYSAMHSRSTEKGRERRQFNSYYFSHKSVGTRARLWNGGITQNSYTIIPVVCMYSRIYMYIQVSVRRGRGRQRARRQKPREKLRGSLASDSCLPVPPSEPGLFRSRQFLLKHRTVDPAFSRPLGLSLGLIPLFVPRCYKPLQSMFSSHLSYSAPLLRIRIRIYLFLLTPCVFPSFSLSFYFSQPRQITAAVCLSTLIVTYIWQCKTTIPRPRVRDLDLARKKNLRYTRDIRYAIAEKQNLAGFNT